MVNKKNKKIKRINEFKEGTYALLSEEWKQREKNIERMTTVEGDPHYEPVTEYNIETYHSMLNAGGNIINEVGSGLIKRKYILRNKRIYLAQKLQNRRLFGRGRRSNAPPKYKQTNFWVNTTLMYFE